MKCVAIANQKGGVGKTTLSVNLAHNLTLAGSRVLLIDIDTQGNATTSLGVSKSHQGTYRFLKEGKFFLEEIISLEKAGFQLLPSSNTLRNFEMDHQSLGDQKILVKAFGEELDRWDYVLLDCPPSLGILTVNALALASDLIIPVQPEFLAMEGLAQMVEAQQHIHREVNKDLKIQGVILNMTQPDQELSTAVEQEVRNYFGDLVYKQVIRRDVVLAEAPSHGETVFDYAPRSAGCLAMIEVTREFLQRSRSQRDKN